MSTAESQIDFYLQVVQTAILLVAVIIAWVAIKYQRDTTKKAKTIELLAKDLEFLAGINILREVVKDKTAIEIYAAEDNKYKSEVVEIRRLLNYCEDISVGVAFNIYDFEMIKQSRKSSLIRIYSITKPFIVSLRQQNDNPSLYIEFEKFVDILND